MERERLFRLPSLTAPIGCHCWWLTNDCYLTFYLDCIQGQASGKSRCSQGFCMWWIISLAALEMLSLAFDSLTMMCLCMHPFECILEICWASWKCRFGIVFLQSWEVFGHYLLKYSFFHFLYSSRTPFTCTLAQWCPKGVWGSVHFSSFFFLLLRLDNLDLFSSVLILQPDQIALDPLYFSFLTVEFLFGSYF